MKKVLLTTILMLAGFSMISAQEAQQNDTLGWHPYLYTDPVAPKLAHWSLWIEGGFNIFDGDYTSDQKNIVWIPSAGAGVMYSWNCTWGIGAEYKFRNYKVEGKGGTNYPDVMLHGYMHQIDGFITFDIFNAWRPQFTKKIFALDLLVGGGAAWSKSDIYHSATDKNGRNKGEFIGSMDKYNMYRGSMDSYKPSAIFLGGASFEFNVSRSIELGLRCVYNYTTKDELIDGRVCGNNNDGFFDCDLLLRWKIIARRDSHVRNLCSTDVLAMEVARQAARGKEAEQEPRQKDTLVIFHKDTIVSIQKAEAVAAAAPEYDVFYSVYFDNDKYNIRPDARTIIQQASEYMDEHPDCYAEIIGYADYTGKMAHNRDLSWNRCDNVIREMNEEYDIDTTRMVRGGFGALKARHSEGSFSANRRVEIHIVNKVKFDQLKEKYGNITRDDETLGEKAERGENVVAYRQNVKTAFEELVAERTNQQVEKEEAPVEQPAEQPAEEKKSLLDQVKEQVIDSLDKAIENIPAIEQKVEQEAAPEALQETRTVTAKKRDTLRKLARQYYGNANCWVYLYQANKTGLGGSKRLQEGQQVFIPDLPESQQEISSQQARQIYKSLRK